MQKYTKMLVESIRETEEGSNIFHLVLSYSEKDTMFSQCKPGQFIMLRTSNMCIDTLFGRPFSVASASREYIELYFLMQGKITQKMSQLMKGDSVDVWGPLGNYYSVPEQKTLIIAGGIGIAPFLGYVRQYNTENTEFLFGHRISIDSYPYKEIAQKCNKSFAYNTEKEPLAGFLEIIQRTMLEYKNGKILVCGPLPLLRTVQKNALEAVIHTELSVEEHMMCGVGGCLACVCKTTEKYPKEYLRNSYAQSCTEGPIFRADHIIL